MQLSMVNDIKLLHVYERKKKHCFYCCATRVLLFCFFKKNNVGSAFGVIENDYSHVHQPLLFLTTAIYFNTYKTNNCDGYYLTLT